MRHYPLLGSLGEDLDFIWAPWSLLWWCLQDGPKKIIAINVLVPLKMALQMANENGCNFTAFITGFWADLVGG